MLRAKVTVPSPCLDSNVISLAGSKVAVNATKRQLSRSAYLSLNIRLNISILFIFNGETPMIRLQFFLRRKAELSLQDFQSYWLNEHGPLVLGLAADLNILRYIQVHTLDVPMTTGINQRGGEMEPAYDGVAELWWDNEESLEQAMASEAGTAAGAALLQDEQKFIDLPHSPLYLAYEYPQINPTPEDIIAHPDSSIFKFYFPLRHLQSLAEEEVRRYWLTNHGPLIRAHAPASGILRYIQVHRAGHPLDDSLRASRGTITEPYLGHAEVWTDSAAAAQPGQAAAGRAAVEDESKFIDFKRSAIWIAKEHSILDHFQYDPSDRRDD